MSESGSAEPSCANSARTDSSVAEKGRFPTWSLVNSVRSQGLLRGPRHIVPAGSVGPQGWPDHTRAGSARWQRKTGRGSPIHIHLTRPWEEPLAFCSALRRRRHRTAGHLVNVLQRSALQRRRPQVHREPGCTQLSWLPQARPPHVACEYLGLRARAGARPACPGVEADGCLRGTASKPRAARPLPGRSTRERTAAEPRFRYICAAWFAVRRRSPSQATNKR